VVGFSPAIEIFDFFLVENRGIWATTSARKTSMTCASIERFILSLAIHGGIASTLAIIAFSVVIVTAYGRCGRRFTMVQTSINRNKSRTKRRTEHAKQNRATYERIGVKCDSCGSIESDSTPEI
jgi:hypothetical protein